MERERERERFKNKPHQHLAATATTTSTTLFRLTGPSLPKVPSPPFDASRASACLSFDFLKWL